MIIRRAFIKLLYISDVIYALRAGQSGTDIGIDFIRINMYYYKCVRSYFDDLSSHRFGIRITVDPDDINLFAFKFECMRSSDLVSNMVGVEWSNGDWDSDDCVESECVLY